MEDLKKHISEKPSVVKPVADYITEKFDLLEVEHGYNDEGDYIWHFANAHRSRPFPNDIEYVCRVIATYFDPHIPKGVDVDVFFPPADWEKKVLTVIGRKLGKKWNFDEEKINAELETIGKLLSETMSKQSPRKRTL